MKYIKGLLNPISITLFVVMVICLIQAYIMLSHSRPHGFLWLLGGSFLMCGFRMLKPSPRQVGLVTILGQKTDMCVEGISLLLDQFGLNIFSMVVFEMRKVETLIKIDSARCADGVYVKSGKEGGEEGISFAWMPNSKELRDFDDAGQEAGVTRQTNGIIVSGIKKIVAEGIPGVVTKEDCTYKWVISNPSLIAKELIRIIESGGVTDTDTSDDTRGLGIIVTKLQVPLVPMNEAIIKADEDMVMEELKRKGQLKDTETINQQVKLKIDFYVSQGIKREKIDPMKIRDEVVYERAQKAGDVTITTGGRNLTVTRNP